MSLAHWKLVKTTPLFSSKKLTELLTKSPQLRAFLLLFSRMETAYVLLITWLLSAEALGVGSSSLAVASFMMALKDQEINISERQMLGVIYYALRVAMVMLTISLFLLSWLFPGTFVSTPMLWLMLVVLFLNAFLMSKHLISVTVGPSLQAATWYTFGFIIAIDAFVLMPLTWTLFICLYLADFLIALAIINGLLWWLKRSNDQK